MSDALADAVAFLRAFARTQARVKLYGPGHPARNQAMAEAFGHLSDALESKPELVFTFLEGEVILDDERVRELRGWEPGQEMARAGIERMEFGRGIERKEFGSVVRSVGRRLADPDAPASEEDFAHARFGKVAVKSSAEAFREVGLEEEAEAVAWLQDKFRQKGEVETAVARAVVLSVGSAVRQSQNVLDLLVPLREQDEYSTAHSMNVSVLAIGLAESLGYTGDDVRSLGEAAVLHDLGKQRVPAEILQKPAGLTEEEWAIIRRHPEEGARLLLQSDDQLDLAALVAYEHHREWSGGGYPELRFPRRPHPASQLIQICDVYDALRTRRPFRDPWPRARIMEHIHEGSGHRFDPQIVRSFASMIEQLEAEQSDRERDEQGDAGDDDSEPGGRRPTANGGTEGGGMARPGDGESTRGPAGDDRAGSEDEPDAPGTRDAGGPSARRRGRQPSAPAGESSSPRGDGSGSAGG